jgi:hypothetical protein
MPAAIARSSLRPGALRSGLIFRDVLFLPGGCYCRIRKTYRKVRSVSMSKSRAVLTILYGEGNREVLASQSALLEQAGYQVKPAIARKGVQEELNKARFDLVVLGQTLTRDDRHHLPYMVKKANSDSAVLVLHADGARHPAVDSHVDTGSSGEELLEKILEITGKTSLSKPAVAGK